MQEAIRDAPTFVHANVYCELYQKPQKPIVRPVTCEDKMMLQVAYFEKVNAEEEFSFRDFLEHSFSYDFHEIHVHDYWF